MPAAAPAKFSELPVIMPKRIRITASIGSTPALVIMGIAMEPIMMIAPKPLIPKKTNAVAAVIKVANAMGLSPESSAAFLIMASEIFVFCITLANMAPKTTSTIGALRRKEPFTTILPNQSKKGTPQIKAIHAAIKGRANKVGKRRFTINIANSTKPNKSKIPAKLICIPSPLHS